MNAIADVVVSRSKLGNVATSCGGLEVPCLNIVSVDVAGCVSEDCGSLCVRV